MHLLDLTIFYFGVYGIAWSFVYAKPLNFLRKIIEKTNINFLIDLTKCVVCASFWPALLFTQLYFKNELWFTKILILFSTITVSWILTYLLQD